MLHTVVAARWEALDTKSSDPKFPSVAHVKSAELANHLLKLNDWRAKRLERVEQRSGAAEKLRIEEACPEVPGYRLADENGGGVPDALGDLLKHGRLDVLHPDFLDWFKGPGGAHEQAQQLTCREGKKASIKESKVMREVIALGDGSHDTKRTCVDPDAEEKKVMLAIVGLLVDYNRKTQRPKSDILTKVLANVKAEEDLEPEHDKIDLADLIQILTDQGCDTSELRGGAGTGTGAGTGPCPGAGASASTGTGTDAPPIFRSLGSDEGYDEAPTMRSLDEPAPAEASLQSIAKDAVLYVRNLFGRG